MIIKNKALLKILRDNIPSFKDTNFITGLWSYYHDKPYQHLMCNNYIRDHISSVYINKPINANGIVIDDVKIGVSLAYITEKSVVFRQIGNKVIVGIDLSNCKIFTNTPIINQIASYYLGKYLLPRYFLSDKFKNMFDSYIGDTDSADGYMNKYLTYVDYAKKVNCSDKAFMSSSSRDLFISSIDDIVTKYIITCSDLFEKYKYLNKLETTYNGSYRDYFKGSALQNVHEVIVNDINDGLAKCNLRLSDDMISRIKAKGTYVSDTVLPLFYIDDVKIDTKSRLMSKTNKVHMMVVSKEGDLSYTGKEFSSKNTDLNSSIHAWIIKTFRRTKPVSEFTLFEIK